MYIINLNSISWLQPNKRHWLSASSVWCGNSTGPASPWFLWAAQQLFGCPGKQTLSPHAALTASQGRGKMPPICLPMNAFLRGERPLCFNTFPLDRNLGRGKGGTSVSFYCFYLSSYLRRFFYFLSLNPKQKKKKKFCTITHYYFQKKNRLSKKFRMGRNLQKCPLIAGVFHLIPGGYSQ